jgi:hypothetical protein
MVHFKLNSSPVLVFSFLLEQKRNNPDSYRDKENPIAPRVFPAIPLFGHNLSDESSDL